MKVMAILLGLAVGGLYVDHQYYNGRYYHGFLSMIQQIAMHFGWR